MVRIVVPSIAGSAPDIIARQVAERLTAAWKQQVIVENRPGGNGIVAMSALRQSAPDGYTLGLFHAAAVITPMMYKEAKFDIQRDTEVAATLAYTPMPISRPGTRALPMCSRQARRARTTSRLAARPAAPCRT